jgi:hypothetical protein
MSQNRTAESVEAEAARLRAQLVDVGTDLRAHADPTRVVDAAKASFTRRTGEIPNVLRKNASPIALVLLGGAVGATLIGIFSPRKPRVRGSEPSDPMLANEKPAGPGTKAQLEAALLSTASVGLGYVGGMFMPSTPLENKYLGAPKAAISAQFDAFLNQHVQGMKLATANLFGVSRLSAAALIGLAAAAEILGVTKGNTGRARR